MLLYVMSEHPSVSQTFVVTEAAAVRAEGVPVVGYALARGSAALPAAPLDVICPPPTKWRLIVTALRTCKGSFKLLLQAKRYRPSLGEVARLLLAQAHADYVLARARAVGVTHIHAHFLGRTADVADAIAHKLGCKWTATAHGDDAYAPREPALLRRRLDDVAGIACANGTVEQAIARHARGTGLATRIVHCGVDVSALKFMDAPSIQRVKRVITIARLVPTKGHWTILETAERVMHCHESLEWTIVGGGALFDELRADPRYRALHPRLLLSGPMDHRSTLTQLAAAAVFVLPCEQDEAGASDGIPVALMEAMALGVPVVTTETGGIRELVVDRSTGLIVKPRDPSSLARALEMILYELDESTLRRMRHSARTMVEQEFNASQEATRLIEFLEGLGVVRRKVRW